VEDWEQHFLEKSRRRSEKERLYRRGQQARLTIAAVIVLLLIIGAILGLAVLT
jgi:hypothetical protein